MDTLQVRTGQVSLMILDDSGNERGVFKFNPNDVTVAKKFFEIQGDLDFKQKEFEARIPKCETESEKIDLLLEIVDYFKALIDDCFGYGTSELLFGESKTLSMFEDFFAGITPYYEKASKQRLDKYGKGTKPKK